MFSRWKNLKLLGQVLWHVKALCRNRYVRKGIVYLFIAAIVCVVAILWWPMDTTPYLVPRPSGELRSSEGRLLFAFLNERQQWCFVRRLDEVSILLVKATLAAEDQRFYSHPGIDLVAVLRAFGQNLWHQRVVSGGSTISMQVVKDPALPSSTLPGKFRQLLDAVRFESHSSKSEILTAYFNNAPYGLNLVGCEAASRRYFGKTARELTLSEAALLAALPKGPVRFMPLTHPRQAFKRRNYVLRRMYDEGYIGRAEYDLSRKEPIRAKWHSFPSEAPHLAMRFKSLVNQNGFAVTTLDDRIQRNLQFLVQQNVGAHKSEITNGAAIVVDVPTGRVLGHVGSANFSPALAGSQVDATRAARSPGSTLKPFTYAFAMEQQSLYASEMLLDDNLDYGVFKPENFDRQYHGIVPASEALQRSLNIPAITVLDRVGVDRMYEFLRGIHFTTLKQSPSYYGLGLTLGNCEVRLEDLTAAYLMLASLGEYRPLQYLRGIPVLPAQRALSRGVCLKIYEALEQPLPGEIDNRSRQMVMAQTRVCWKTGTSTGYHDAWTVAFNSQYLVAVWMGNSNGDASKNLVGAAAALPLASAIFRSLPVSNTPDRPITGDDLHAVRICAVTGLPASQWCAKQRTEFLPRCQFLHRVCDVHCPGAVDEALIEYGSRPVERWPGTAKGWDLAHISEPIQKANMPFNATNNRRDSLAILTPVENSDILLTKALDGDRMRLMTSLDDQATLHWYLDDMFIGTASPGRPLILDLTEGNHRVVCMTPEGVTAKAAFRVTMP